MITHVVLFRPRAGLSASDRAGLADALRIALETIPSIRRASIGRRVMHGRPYEQLMRVDYEFAALLDFDDLGGLRAYLDHPAHAALAARFFEMFEEALMYDFALEQGVDAIANLL
jgi:stress responsive alpha/beta barrel protein